ncbi:MAG: virulence factor MviN [Verrucomicrobia bacterium]|nr:MAG: virulence factor MviN [Verrucomicrobiota bacterium]
MIEPDIQSSRNSIWLRLSEGWSRWTAATVNRSIFGAAMTIGAFTVVVKLVSVAKELVVAKTFGTSDALDAFLIAFLLPLFAINVVAGSFNAALIPTFIKVREKEGTEAAQRLLSNMLFWSVGLLVIVTLLFALSANAVLRLMSSSFNAEKFALTRKLFFILLPTLVICGLSTTWSAVLNAGQKFALAALTPALTPIITLGLIFGFGPTWGIHAVAVGTIAGFVLEAGVLGWSLRRQGFSLLPKWRGKDAALIEVIRQFAPMMAGAFLMSSSLVIDQSMASMLGPGSVAALNYGSKVVALILGIGSMALGTAVLPYFSRMVARNEWAGVRHTLRTYLRLCFALQIPFYVAGILGVRLLNALGKGRSIMLICAANMLVNVFGNLILMRWMGVAGIALSTSLVYLLSCVLVFYVILTELKQRQGTAIRHE